MFTQVFINSNERVQQLSFYLIKETGSYLNTSS